ncbi:MAG: elongation factor P lysine(34) lysyltransferase [Porticoccus sp.]|jgi:lysyl-tRNA synthetase class 2|nr:elongation factor P lysine(34) lysyltransferase [Porticoccus sp.]|tara:strand:- start:504 stop:1466 length:963 start_codon:yes stop_codon:yes gene_type:complete
MTFWQPTASIDVLRYRAKTLFSIRKFFYEKGILEVEVPLLGKTGVTDPFIDCFELNINNETKYLQSSPEYFMKRLLASGSGPIYSLGKAFRAEQAGNKHQPEFTILEWYRINFDESQLMAEIADLMRTLEICYSHRSIRYLDVFKEHTSLNPHQSPLYDLQKLASITSGNDFFDKDRSCCLDLIFSLCIEPKLPRGLVFVYDYPVCQSALAQQKKDNDGFLVARRFEVYLDNLELANGYFELNNFDQHIKRFAKDNIVREKLAKKTISIDRDFLESIKSGLPVCSGVAIGIDRLIMRILGLNDITEVISFGSTRANYTNE